MYGSNCHDKSCLHNVGKLGTYQRCILPSRKMFMLCEKPSESQTKKLLKEQMKWS